MTKQQATVLRPVSTTAGRRARAQHRSRENFLLAERQIQSKAFVYKSAGGRSRPPRQVESWDDAYLISFGAHAMDHIPDEEMPATLEQDLPWRRSGDAGLRIDLNRGRAAATPGIGREAQPSA